MTKLLNSLKLSAATKAAGMDAVQQRRNKLVAKIDEQILLAEGEISGTRVSFEKVKRVKADDGVSKATMVEKRVAKWWFRTADGTLALNIKYGTTVIEFAKGLTAIAIEDQAGLLAALRLVKDAVLAGELDVKIDAAANTLRKRFA